MLRSITNQYHISWHVSIIYSSRALAFTATYTCEGYRASRGGGCGGTAVSGRVSWMAIRTKSGSARARNLI